MLWYQFVVPAVVTALLVRLEAMTLGPYWAWVEMFPYMGDDVRTDRQRRSAFARRIAIPGVVGFLLVSFWRQTFGALDVAVIGFAAAGLLLWPLLFNGPPGGVAVRRLWVIYGGLVVAFLSSAWFGGQMAGFAHAEGGVWDFVKENIFGIAFGGVLALFSGAVTTRSSMSASRNRSE